MQPCFWIMSCAAGPCSVLCRELAELRSRSPKPFEWYASPDCQPNQQPPVPLAQLSGAIIVVDHEALHCDAFAEAVSLPISVMADRDDFCVFLWLKDLAVEDLQQLAHQGNPLAVAIVENIQLDPSMEGLEGIVAAIGSYLDNLETLVAFSTVERLSSRATHALGSIATAISIACVLSTLGACLTVHLASAGDTMLAQSSLHEVLVLAMFSSFAILFFRLQALFSLLRCGPELVQKYPRFAAEWMAVCAVGLAISLFGLPVAGDFGARTFIVGAAMGVMLVAIVRKGRRARVRALPFGEVPQLLRTRKLLPQLYSRMADETVNTGRPLFEPVHKRVFISYARSSVWSSRVADEMTASLRDLGAFVFLDRPSLRPGLSWKRQLRWAIVSSNVFVVVLDRNAVRREWVAAEFTAAYRSKILKRTPEIFVIHPDEMDFSESDTPAEAFFSELMVKPSQAIPQWVRSRMAPYTPESRADICRAIWSYPIAGSFGVSGNLILALASSVVVPVVGLACVLGLPLLVIQLFSIQGSVDLSALLAGHSELALPIGFTSALLGGFSLRSAIRSFGDIRRSAYQYVPGPLELLEAVAFFGVVALCLPLLHLVDACFVCLAVFFGLEWGNMFAVCMRTWKQQSA